MITKDLENINKCIHRIESVNNKLKREKEIIGSLGENELTRRLETITDIQNVWNDFSIDQLRHINSILILEMINHDMSIAMCKCANELDISIPEDMRLPNQFHRHILENMKQKRN